jgi:transcriptional regulator with XRE-family HTH domain
MVRMGNSNNIGLVIKHYMSLNDMKVADLSVLTGMSVGAIYNVIQGRSHKVSCIKQIADILKIPDDELFIDKYIFSDDEKIDLHKYPIAVKIILDILIEKDIHPRKKFFFDLCLKVYDFILSTSTNEEAIRAYVCGHIDSKKNTR